jgi:UDP-glucose 4-epimerase
MKSVLVTGGAGFIGSHVLERFLAEGWAVHVLDNLITGKRENLPAGAELHVLDIGAPAAAALVGTLKPDVIAHLAAQMDVRKSVADPVFDATTNVVGTLNLLEAVRQHSPATRFVFSSTGGALYGEHTVPPNVETFPKDPESPYAIAKLSAELYLAYYARVHALDTVALRYGNVYGPRQDPHGEAGVVAIFCGRLLEGRPLTVFGDGKQTRDYVYVTDVADATWRAATQALPSPALLDARAFNVGTGVGTSVVRLAEVLRAAAQRDVPIEYAPKRPGEQQDSFIDVTKAGRVLGWRPAVTLEDGLARSYAFAAQQAARGRSTTTHRSA